MGWRKMLASITGTVDQELLLRNEVLVAENRVLRSQIERRPRLMDPERKTLVFAMVPSCAASGGEACSSSTGGPDDKFVLTGF